MNDYYYHIDISHNFDAESDKEAMANFLEIITVAGIPINDASLKKFRRNTIGDYGTYLYPEDKEEGEDLS